MIEAVCFGAAWGVYALSGCISTFSRTRKETGARGARILQLFGLRGSSQQNVLRTGVLWVCMAYDVITVSALGCRIIDDEVSTQYTRACAHSGLILVGHDYLPLLLVLAAFQLGLAILWMLAGRDARDGQMSSAQVYPAVILKQAPFRQELSRYRGHGMSQLQDLVSGDSASDGVPHILSLLMFDLLFVPSVYAGSAAFVCTDDDYLAIGAHHDIKCWGALHSVILVAAIPLLLWVTLGTMCHYLPLRNYITLWVRHGEGTGMCATLAKSGLAILAVLQHHENIRTAAMVAYASVVSLLLLLSLVAPPCTEDHGVGASTLQVAGLTGSGAVAAVGVCAVLASDSDDASTWPLGLYPVVVFICFHTLSRMPVWQGCVKSGADSELRYVLAAIKQDPSELHLMQLSNMLEYKKPLGPSGTMALAAELAEGQWRLPMLDLSLHGVSPPEVCTLTKAISMQCCELLVLNLMGNQLGNEGAASVAQAIPNCCVTSLDLAYNGISYDGIVAISSALQNKQSQLSQISLSGNHIDVDSARALSESLKENSKLADLAVLQCGMNATTAAALFKGLSQNKGLIGLRLGGNMFGSGAAIPDDGFDELAKLVKCHPAIQILQLDNTRMGRAGAASLASVLAHSKVTELELQGNHLSDQGMEVLCKAMKKGTNLCNISMANCSLGRQSGIHIAKMLQRDKQALTSLDLSNNSLCNFGMFYDGIAALSDAILSHTSLRNLNLERNQLRNMGCWSLAKMIGDPRCRLECLNLASNEIRARGATAIFNAVALSQCVTHLSLRNNIIDSDCVSALQGLLLTNRVLQALDLENNDLCERSGKLIAAALVGNETLSMISLIMNEFRIKEAEHWFAPDVRHLVLLRRKDRAVFDSFQRTPLAITSPSEVGNLQMKSEQLVKTKCIGCNCLFSMMKD